MSGFPSCRTATRASLLALALAMGLAADASAFGRPIVSVPTAPTLESAGAYRLSGKVTANGTPTAATIQYGATKSYGRSSPTVNVWFTSTQLLSHVTAAMPAGSTVHYRVRANNWFGTTYGPDQTYVVAGAGAPVVTAGPRPQAVPEATRAFLLHGTVNGNALPTTTRIEFGPTQSYGTSIAAADVAAGTTSDVSVRVAAPAAGTTINYRTVATNGAGTVYGANRQFKVPGGVVRSVYMYPTDRPFRQRYDDLIGGTVKTIQEFYAAQVGQTFTAASETIRCPMERDNAYYGTEAQNSEGRWIGTWQKLDAALLACTGVPRGPDSDLIVYADVHSLSCNDRIGAATTNLTFMGDNDLRGLDGETGFTNAPCGEGIDFRTGPWGYTGGAAHELGHTFGLPHPDDILATCAPPAPNTPACQQAYDSIMYVGYGDIRSTYLLERDKVKLRASPFFS